jgi:DNA-binding GntR family transcriptional regulator
MANQDPDIVEITAMERPGIVDAMAAGDIATAVRLMEEHIELVQKSTASRIEASRDGAGTPDSGVPHRTGRSRGVPR